MEEEDEGFTSCREEHNTRGELTKRSGGIFIFLKRGAAYASGDGTNNMREGRVKIRGRIE